MDEELTQGVIVTIIGDFESEQKILYLLRSGGKFKGEWWPVAGTVEGAESPIEAALREMREEIDAVPDVIYDLGHEIPNQDSSLSLIGYVAFLGKSTDITLNYEHSEYKWLNVEEAKAFMFDSVRPFFEYLDANFLSVGSIKHEKVWEK